MPGYFCGGVWFHDVTVQYITIVYYTRISWMTKHIYQSVSDKIIVFLYDSCAIYLYDIMRLYVIMLIITISINLVRIEYPWMHIYVCPPFFFNKNNVMFVSKNWLDPRSIIIELSYLHFTLFILVLFIQNQYAYIKWMYWK